MVATAKPSVNRDTQMLVLEKPQHLEVSPGKAGPLMRKLLSFADPHEEDPSQWQDAVYQFRAIPTESLVGAGQALPLLLALPCRPRLCSPHALPDVPHAETTNPGRTAECGFTRRKETPDHLDEKRKRIWLRVEKK